MTYHKKELMDNLLVCSSNPQALLQQLLAHLAKTQAIDLPQLVQMFTEAKGEMTIPLYIFSTKLHPVEALCKYLKEEHHLSFQDIAQILSRKNKSVWAAYQRAKRKMKQPFLISSDQYPFKNTLQKYPLPLQLFNHSSFTFLESIVFYLHQVHHLNNKTISQLLHKSPNSIAVLYKRAHGKKEPEKISEKNRARKDMARENIVRKNTVKKKHGS